MDDAVFRRFGEDATYISRFGQKIADVRVVRKEPDEEPRFGDSRVIMPTCRLRVRRAQVPDLGEGDRFVLIEDGAELEIVVTGDPMLNARRTIWTTGAEPVDVSR
ncbi:head-tail joining protein [Sphingomonas bisphenolicum]